MHLLGLGMENGQRILLLPNWQGIGPPCPPHIPTGKCRHALRPGPHRAEAGPGAMDGGGGFPNLSWLWAHRGQEQPPAQSCRAPINAQLMTKPVFFAVSLSEVLGAAECLTGPPLWVTSSHPSLLPNPLVPPQSLCSPICSLPYSLHRHVVLRWVALGLGFVGTAFPLNA